jgi:hypothetical protein
MAVGCMLVSAAAGCSSGSPVRVDDPSIPGTGATRHDWDASHTPNPDSDKFDKGAVYGYDPSLPSYLSGNEHAVYIAVFDHDTNGTKRIDHYILNMPEADMDGAMARVRMELPSDATFVRDVRLDRCYRVVFSSATSKAAMHGQDNVTELSDMVEVQLDELGEGGRGKPTLNPYRFNQAWFQLGAHPAEFEPAIDCG